MGIFLNVKPVEFIISNPEKTDRFYYGKSFPNNPFPLTDPDLINIYNSSNIIETSLPEMMKSITRRKKRILFWSILFSLLISFLSLPFTLYFPAFTWHYSPGLFPLFSLILFL